MAQAAGGEPTRFLTLTVSRESGTCPEERFQTLRHAFQVIVKRLRRRFPDQSIEYFVVVEATKAGEPHLHILLRSPYIEQRLLSAWMDELASAPIVDIRRVKGVREVVRYVAKYISKAPAQFGHAKRYWCSRAWEADPPEEEEIEPSVRVKWSVDRRPRHEIFYEWHMTGFLARKGEGDSFIGLPNRSPPWERVEAPSIGYAS